MEATKTDTTVRKNAASLIARWHAIESGVVVVQFSSDGTILDANDRFLDATGFATEDLVGSHHRSLVDAEAMGSEAYEQLWTNLREGQPVERYEELGRAGSRGLVRATYCPHANRKGEVDGVVLIAQEVSAEQEMWENLVVAGQFRATARQLSSSVELIRNLSARLFAGNGDGASAAARIGRDLQKVSAVTEELLQKILEVTPAKA